MSLVWCSWVQFGMDEMGLVWLSPVWYGWVWLGVVDFCLFWIMTWMIVVFCFRKTWLCALQIREAHPWYYAYKAIQKIEIKYHDPVSALLCCLITMVKVFPCHSTYLPAASGDPGDSGDAGQARPGHGSAHGGGACKAVWLWGGFPRRCKQHFMELLVEFTWVNLSLYVFGRVWIGLVECCVAGSVSSWMRLKPKIWSTFDEPYSSSTAKVRSKVGKHRCR